VNAVWARRTLASGVRCSHHEGLGRRDWRSVPAMPVTQVSPLQRCVIDPVTEPRWGELVERTDGARIFHHPSWLRLLRDFYRYPITAVCLADGSELVAGLPIAIVRSRVTGVRLVSLPFTDVCEPLCDAPDREEELRAAVEAERRRLALPLEVHADLGPSYGGSCSERFYHHVVTAMGGADAVFGRVNPAKRRAAARARTLGVSVEKRTDPPAVAAFFALHVRTRRRLGIPTQPRGFFSALRELLDDGFGFVLLARWRDRPIAANIYLLHKRVLTYKYGASDPAHLDKRPNDLLQMEALRILCDAGCETFDMGRTELDNHGLQRFKRQLGAEQRELRYTRLPASPDQRTVRSVSGFQRALIRRAPPAFGRYLGAAIYRHFG